MLAIATASGHDGQMRGIRLGAIGIAALALLVVGALWIVDERPVGSGGELPVGSGGERADVSSAESRGEPPGEGPEPMRSWVAPQNVILISLDTLRADHLGAWGYPEDTSPRLDALAARSAVFRRAVAQANSTIPSHASLFTSRYPSEVLRGDSSRPLESRRLRPGARTLTEGLAEAGFATWGFVDGGNVRGVFGFDRGFDVYVDDKVGVRSQVERAQRWIEEHPVSRFFVFLHTYEIHTPYAAPRTYVEMFGNPDFRGTFVPGAPYFREIEENEEAWGEELHREVVARYDAGIRYTDTVIGEFLDWLEGRGLLEKSLVVVVSDHGKSFSNTVGWATSSFISIRISACP